MMRVLLLLLIGGVLSRKSQTSKRVAVVGAGIGGASASYFLRKSLGDGVEIDIYERNDYIGGRLKSIDFHGARCNLGGDAWASSNANMIELQKELNIPLDESNFDGNGKNGVWDGEKLYSTDHFEPITDLEMWFEIEVLKKRLAKTYGKPPFASIKAYVQDELAKYVSQSAAEFADAFRVNPYFARILWEPLTRTIYDQSLNMTLFGAMVALLSADEDAFSAKFGNDFVVERLVNASGARVHLSTPVAAVNASTSALIDRQGNVLQHYDELILAAPVEMLQISGLPPFLPHRPYHHWYVTLVAATSFNRSHFKTSSEVPDSLLTTSSTTSDWTMCSILAQGSDLQNIYKCFSNVDISSLVQSNSTLFVDVKDSLVHHWPMTFPSMTPNAAFQPLQEGNIYNLNAMESVAVAMEGSVIAGKNIAQLIAAKGK